MGRVRGPGLGPAAAARARAGGDGGSSGSRRPSWVRRAGCRSTARSARAELDRYGLRLVGGFVPVVVHEPDLGDTRADARARGRPARRGRRRRLRRGARRRPRVVGAAGPRRRRAGSAPASTCASSPTSSPPEGLELVLHPHVGTLVETAADVERALAHTDVPLVLRHRSPADRRRRPGRASSATHADADRPRPPQGRRRAPRGGASAAARCRSSRPRRPGCSGRSAKGTRGSTRSSASSSSPGTSAGSCSSRTSRSPARSPRPAVVLPSMCARASSSCPHGLRGERVFHR